RRSEREEIAFRQEPDTPRRRQNGDSQARQLQADGAPADESEIRRFTEVIARGLVLGPYDAHARVLICAELAPQLLQVLRGAPLAFVRALARVDANGELQVVVRLDVL